MIVRLFRACFCGLFLLTVGCISSRETLTLNGAKEGEFSSWNEVPSFAISWNVHKASDDRFVREVEELMGQMPQREKGIFCLQEARSSTFELIKRQKDGELSGHYSPSWRYPFSRKSTGVLTLKNGSQFESSAEQIRTKRREFFIVSPKVSLRSELDYGSGRKLQVINCHGLNFVPFSYFEKQLDEIFESLPENDYPAIVCGDFNVWNVRRLEALREKAKRVGLMEAVNRSPGESAAPKWLRGFNVINGYDPELHLDRFFTRGVKVIDCYTAKGSLSSDHLPVILRFKLNENYKP